MICPLRYIAFQFHQNCVRFLISQANFLIIKQEFEEAKKVIKKSVSLWLPKYQAVEDSEAVAGSFDPVEVCPLTHSVRFQTARILIEVEEYQLAADVLEGLLNEDDEVIPPTPSHSNIPHSLPNSPMTTHKHSTINHYFLKLVPHFVNLPIHSQLFMLSLTQQSFFKCINMVFLFFINSLFILSHFVEDLLNLYSICDLELAMRHQYFRRLEHFQKKNF